jgi:large repetitive protein
MSRKKQEQRRATRRLFVESLESRRVLAGNVSAALSGYHLLITGDNLANEIDIAAHATIPGRVVVTPAAGTTLNNLTLPLTFPSFGDIRITMNGGDDNVDFLGDAGEITDTIPGSLVVNNGEGNNTFTLSDYNIGNALSITSGAGVDNIALTNNTIARDVTIYNGHATGVGRQTTTIETDNTIGGSLRMSNLNGDNDIFISGEGPISIGRDLSINNAGAGLTDDVIIDMQTVNVGNNLTIVNRPVADISIADSTVTRSAAIRNGNGNNNVVISTDVVLGSTTTDRFSILNGIGDHTITLDALTVNGYSDIRSTAGALDVTIGDDSSCTFNGALSITAGAGGRHVSQITDSLITGDMNVFHGNSTDINILALSTTTVNGKSTVRNGNSVNGNAFYCFDTTTLNGAVTVVNGTTSVIDPLTANAVVMNDGFVANSSINILSGTSNSLNAFTLDGTVTGSVTVRLGNAVGGHLVDVGNTDATSVTGNLSLFTGSGDASVIVDDVTVGGNLSVYTNSGDDFIALAGNGAALVVTGTTYVDSGAGDDTILLADSTATATFIGFLNVRAGLGIDNITIGANVDNSVGTAIASGLFLFDGGTDPIGSNIITVNTNVVDPFLDPLTFSKFKNLVIVTIP